MNLFITSILWLLSLTTNTSKPHTISAVAAIDTVKIVSGIKVKFGAIDAKRKSYSQYMPTKREEGKLYIGYYEANTLKMITAITYGDTSKVEADEYLDESGIVMVYAKVSSYESSIAANPNTKVKAMVENWYYFDKQTLIKWVSGGKVVPAGSAAFKQKSAAIKTELANTKKQFADMATLSKIK
ncbi:MAG: hypothetical protein CFE21_04290 [Bacteroidetes bacterium B1(2017)]|nr:MAG: hypothetical protein CFE21_04290 [Bacteroidetes bacterium B1(2017)]